MRKKMIIDYQWYRLERSGFSLEIYYVDRLINSILLLLVVYVMMASLRIGLNQYSMCSILFLNYLTKLYRYYAKAL
jgi:hypothetical protein